MSTLRKLLFTMLFLHFTNETITKIILPQNLRYLQNMLNSDVIAKAAKIRQRLESNPNNIDGDKGWPTLLAKYQDMDGKQPAEKHPKDYSKSSYGYYNRRFNNYY